jgi:LAO/AO transport system kinase
MNGASLADRVRAGERTALARALSLVEDRAAGAEALLDALHPHLRNAPRLGLTGPPGAGKSTLASALAGVLRGDGVTVGIVAVDPTSPFTGGAILGDRVRMGRHAGDPGVFVRSMATRGHLGGLARATADAAAVLDAAGTDTVLIETVGVGQDEVDIVGTADVTIVVLVPEAGDDVQAIKAGIMEIADIFVVNKADREGADRMAQAVSAALSLQTFATDQWCPPVLQTSATAGEGIEELWGAIRRFRERPGHDRAVRTRARHAARLRQLLVQQLLRRVARAVPDGDVEALVDRMAARELDPYTAVEEIVARTCGAPGRRRAGAAPDGGGTS